MPHSNNIRPWHLNHVHLAGLAAGFDKDADAVKGLLGLGFGFVEVGAF